MELNVKVDSKDAARLREYLVSSQQILFNRVGAAFGDALAAAGLDPDGQPVPLTWGGRPFFISDIDGNYYWKDSQTLVTGSYRFEVLIKLLIPAELAALQSGAGGRHE